MIPLHLFATSLLDSLQRKQHEIPLHLREQNRVLKAQLPPSPTPAGTTRISELACARLGVASTGSAKD